MNNMATLRNTDQTRETLLRSAFCEMHRHGFQGASIASILESTGLTKGALYHHFPTKHALGLAVIDEIIAPKIEQVLLTPVRESATPVAALLEVLTHLPDVIGEDNILLGCPLNNLIQEMSPLDDMFRQRLNEVLIEWRNVLQQAFEHGQQQRIIRPDVNCADAALFVQSAWEGCIGIAKSTQSVAVFRSCIQQLSYFVRSLMISGTN